MRHAQAGGKEGPGREGWREGWGARGARDGLVGMKGDGRKEEMEIWRDGGQTLRERKGSRKRGR